MKLYDLKLDPKFDLQGYIDRLKTNLKIYKNEYIRLNNIINELEKYLEEQSTNLNRLSCNGHVYFMYQEDLNILNKLKELKEDK